MNDELNKDKTIRSSSRKNNFSFLSLVSCLALIFALHRSLSFTSLLPLNFGNYQTNGINRFKIFFVGFLSDFWVAIVIGLIGSILAHVLSTIPLFRGRQVVRWTLSTTLVCTGLITAIHQAYVEFFRFQLVPFHLSYLLDKSFLAANSQSLMSMSSVLILGFTILFTFLFQMVASGYPSWVTMTLLVFLGIIAHNRNIHWRVQWFIPEQLQVHFLEQLYIHASRNSTPRALDGNEWKRLAGWLNFTAPLDPQNPIDILKALAPPPPVQLHPIAMELRNRFSQKIHSGRKPVLMIVLLESLRPSETGFYSPSSPSLTPNLDALATKSVAFMNAFSTGSVTRGGQEAVLCGLQSQRNYSLMRRGILFNYPSCLFKELKGEAETFWYHGGDGRFDNQLEFWQSQTVNDTIASHSFSSDTPRTSWGVGDLTFLLETSKILAKKRQTTPHSYLFGSVLTISNHIPWDIPTDIPSDKLKKDPFNLGTHPSHRSTAYMDFAIGQFVDRLKELSIWENSIVLFVSDHGTSLPPFNKIYPETVNLNMMLYSHIVYLVSGGITEQIIEEEDPVDTSIFTFTSQSSVAAFVLDLLRHSQNLSPNSTDSLLPMLAEHPFSPKRERPVISALEDQLFSPANNQSWKFSEINSNQSIPDLEVLYYRAMIQMYNTPQIN